MKTLSFTHRIFLFLSLFILCACTEQEEDIDGGVVLGEWIEQLNEADQIVSEVSGYTHLYYLNEDGSGWIDPQKTDTYPVAYFEETNDPQSLIGEVKSDAGFQVYDRGAIGYDKEEELYYYQPHAFLDGTANYSFPIYWNGCIDWMKISFKYAYVLEGILGTKFVHTPTKCEYNGTQLFSISPEDPETSLADIGNKKIFIRKTKEGGVSVSFKR